MVYLFLGAAVRGSEPQAPVLLVVGDSLSAAYKIPIDKGWVHLLSRRLEEKGYRYRVVNASIPGDTTAGGLSRLPVDLKRYQPAIVVIELGGNDGLQGLPLTQMQDNLTQMVTLSQRSGARVLLVGVRMPPNYGPVYTKRFAEAYREVAKQAGVALVPEILAGVAAHPELMQAGGLHPRAAGEARVLDNVWKGLRPLLGRPELQHGIPENKASSVDTRVPHAVIPVKAGAGLQQYPDRRAGFVV